MKLTVPLAVMASGIFSSACAAEATPTRYLADYQHTKANTDAYKASFFANAGDGTLEVKKTGQNFDTSVWLNGKQILDGGAVGRSDRISETSIVLLDGADNQLEVRMQGSVGNAVNVRIKQHVNLDFQFTSS